ncbi:MAG: DUF368 domain-containing protein [Anaerolineae bacterium]|nr:DUF368 domain-containing protein [Anaerolineae bacterium]
MSTIESEPPRVQRSVGDYLGLVVRGFFMGAADIVPGVCGGTLAFILGIYEELINSIKAIDTKLLQLLSRLKFKTAMDSFPWQFLLSVGVGIGLAILTLASFLEQQLETNPTHVWAFFFGLVLASVITVGRSVSQWNVTMLASTLLGLVGGYLLVGVVPVQTPEAPWFLFLSGAIAICAMILPGISGAFILVLLGKYQYVLAAVNDRDILTIALVGAGAAFGIVTFARILSWLFKNHRDTTIAVLTGLMIGSMRKIWPWKVTLNTTVDRHGEIVPLDQANILPAAFDGDVAFGLGWMLLGVLAVLALSRLAGRQEESKAPGTSG